MNLIYNLFKTLPFMAVFYLLHGMFHFGFMDRASLPRRFGCRWPT